MTNDSYTYHFADDTVSRLRAGEDGVTEEWLERLRQWDREEESGRRKHRRHCISYDELAGMSLEPGAWDELPDPTPTQEEAVRQTVLNLHPEDRRLIVQVYYRHIPQYILARMMGISPSALAQRLKRIRNREIRPQVESPAALEGRKKKKAP